ncbi:MAG: nickel pincer cofactor biosynthesis protein LarC [Ilumatobacter sp.]|uniref:nickel pincer cofactor biosynthesis protein LarC n=1 Tax=Ilumatobacter sp. TaxID=1967498 RepID=UPI0032981F8F
MSVPAAARIGWIDGTAGASGDMLLGAVVDAGVPLALVQDGIDRFDLGITLRSESVVRAGLAATKVHVDVPRATTMRHLPEIVELLTRLDGSARDRAVATFERLARAEAKVHATSIDDVHFHEVGALDSIADVAGVCIGMDALDLAEVHCSTLSLGSGSTRGAHGPIPVPAPAVLAVLDGIAPVAAGPAPYESTTPTGAALLAEWVTAWGPMPAMRLGSTGMGAGTKDTEAVANVTRLVIGAPVVSRSVSDSASADESMIVLEANVDDLDPRVWPEAITEVMRAGAVDAWVTPIVMKKGRPAHTFSALCRPDAVDAVSAAIFASTSTIGLRRHVVEREALERSESSVEVEGHRIGVKIARRNGEVVNVSAEWDDVATASHALGRPAVDVLRAAHDLA